MMVKGLKQSLGTFLDTRNKDKIKGYEFHNPVTCIIIGLALGSLGSEVGRHISKKLDEKRVTLLFQVAIALVMAISIYNFFKFGR